MTTFLDRIVGNELDEVRRALAEDPSLARVVDDELGSTPLHYAAHRGYAAMAELLVDAGADVNAAERVSAATPLHWAAEGGHADIVHLLLARGAVASLHARDGWFDLPPLGWATVVDWAPQFRVDRGAAAAALRAAGAVGDAFVAIAEGDESRLRAVLVADAPVVLARRLGFAADAQQPLHLAITRARPALARVCIEAGAALGARTARGLTPLALAYEAKDAATTALLVERGVRAEEDPACAFVTGAYDRLVAPDEGLLFLAAERGVADAVRALLRAGTDPEARTTRLVQEVPTEVTAAQIAEAGGYGEVAALFA